MPTPIIIPMPITTPPRNCITVHDRVYCEDRDVPTHELGWAILIIMLIIVWVGVPIQQDWFDRRALYWYGVPPILLAIALLIFGS